MAGLATSDCLTWLLGLAACLGIGGALIAGRAANRWCFAAAPEAAARPPHGELHGEFTVSDPTSPIGHLSAAFRNMAIKFGLNEAEREKIVRALREGEERLQVAQDVAGLGVWDWDHRAGRIAWSPQMFRLTGVASDQGATDLFMAWLGVLHPGDRDRMEQAVMRLLRTLEPLTAEYRIVNPEGAPRWLLMRAQSLPDEMRRPFRTVIINLDITSSKENEVRERFLLGLSDRIRDLLNPGEILAAATESLGRHLGISRLGYGEIRDSSMVLTVLADWHTDDLPAARGRHSLVPFGPALCEELRAGRTFVIEDALLDPRTEGHRDAYDAPQVRAAVCVPLVKEGQLCAMLYLHTGVRRRWSPGEVDLCRDVAERTWAAFERARSNARQRLLINELNHRVKNTLATVQSIAAQSFRTGQSEAAREAFEARLFALSKTHDVLTRENWEGVNLYDIVEEALAPYGKDHAERYRITGEPLQLPPRMALSLAMAMHELSTNAAKYGAFSTDAGRIAIRWDVTESGVDRRLTLLWQEEGGPVVQAPTRKGFGSRLIERGLTRELAGEVDLDYRPGGLVCTIRFPLPKAPELVEEEDLLGFS
jgi:two-component sensor histidine kinase/PAS domain-containing protein